MDKRYKVNQKNEKTRGQNLSTEENLKKYIEKEKKVNGFQEHIKNIIKKEIQIKNIFSLKKVDEYFMTLKKNIKFKEYDLYQLEIEFLICSFDDLLDITLFEYRNGVENEIFTGQYDINKLDIFKEDFEKQIFNFDFL